MSNYASDLSIQEGTLNQPLDTPSRPDASKGRKPRNSRNQRHQKPKQQPSSVSNGTDNGLNSNALSMEQDIAHSGAGEDSQDSTPQRHPIRQGKRSGQRGTPNRPQDYKTTAIPAFDGTSSPGRAQPVSRATSSQAAQATPVKQAYAGATFQASPAASSLPIPKFLARSVPATDPHQTHSAFEDDLSSRNSPAGEGELENLKYHSQQPLPPPREESPLDVLFNAQRVERARQKSGEALQSTGYMSQRSMIPESAERARHAPNSRPNSNSPAYKRPNSGASTEKAMFMMELDGTGDSETSEDSRPSVSFRDRLGATRSTSSLSVTQTNDNSREEYEMQRHEKSQALKNLLMQQRTPIENPVQRESADFRPIGTGNGYARRHEVAEPPSDPHRALQGANTSTTATGPSATDVRAMEDNLRRILKLNP